MCALTAHDDGDDSLLTRLRWCHLCQQHVDSRVTNHVPKRWRTASSSVNRKYSEKRKNTEAMKYVVRHLLPMSGSKICTLSSAQIERHSVTNWCPVALIGAIARSTGKWSKQFKEMRNPQGTKPKVSSFWIHHYHRQRPARRFLCSARDSQIELSLLPDSIMERRDVWWRPVSAFSCAALHTSPAPEKHGPSLAAPGKETVSNGP